MWAFNALYDHPRILSLPRTDLDRGLSLWDPRFYLNVFPWMVPEKIMWDDINLQGESDRIATIAAYRSPVYGVQCITGLAFTYKSGETRIIGYTQGQLGREVSVGDHDKIVLLELFSGRFGLLEIIVHDQPNA